MSTIDSLEPVKLGERLRIARSNAGLKQEDAARELGISRTTLISIEQGQRKIRAEELRRLSVIYRTSVNELLRDSAIHVDLVGKFRRSAPAHESNNVADEALRLLNRLASAAVELESRLGQRQKFHYPAERPILPGGLDDQAEDLALELRHRLGLGIAPITDIVSLVELELGVRIFFRPLHSTISGVFAFDIAVGPCMLINSLHPPERQVLTVVHELGHFMCMREMPNVFSIDEREESREERFVTLFSIAFLMPAVAIRRRFRDFIGSGSSFTPRHLLLMAHAFGVSFEAICRRLEFLSLLPKGTFESLRERGFSIENAKRTLGLPAPVAPTTPPRLTLLAIAAYKRGLVSEGQLCEMLVLDRVQLREQLDNFGGDELDDALTLET